MRVPAAKCLDLMADLESITRRRHSLQSVYASTFNENLAGDGLDRVKAWKEGDVPRVIEGTTRTVSAIQRLHEYGAAHGKVMCSTSTDGGVEEVKVGW